MLSLQCILLYLVLRLFPVYSSNEEYPIPVLVLVPYPDPRNDSGWDRGLELIPAARVAVKEINNHTNLLPGYKIQLMEASSDACSVIITAKSLINLSTYTLSTSRPDNAIAVTGLGCSTVTAAVSPIAGKSEIDLIQISMSTSPIFRNQNRYRRLWRVLPSSLPYNKAMIALMDHFNWNKVSTIYDEQGVYFQTTAELFREVITKSASNTLVLHLGIDDSDIFINHALDQIANETARIIYVSTTIPQSGILMCKAANRNLIWPGFVWIFRSVLQTDIIETKPCDLEILNKALENVLFLSFPLNNRQPNDVLVSGYSYDQYRKKYFKELEELQKEDYIQQYLSFFKFQPNGSDYSNPMYDEIWALALALNSSLPDLESRNLSLKNYHYNMSEITYIIERHLKNVSFSGAVGEIKFDDNSESLLPVEIYQIRNEYSILIGKYQNDVLSLWNISEGTFPGDDIDIRYDLFSKPLPIILSVESSICFLFTTITLLLMLCLYKTPEIRATSPLLTILIFIGVYMNIVTSVMILIVQSIVVSSLAFSILCNVAHRLLEAGLNLIIATVLMKLARISIVFCHFHRSSKIWHDHYLVIVIIAIAYLIPFFINVIFLSLDPLKQSTKETMLYNENPPIKVISSFCSNEFYFLWEFLTMSYTIVLLAGLVFFAIKTRKIDRKHFKDTKKTIGFVFTMTLTGSILLPIIKILEITGNINTATILLLLTLHLTVYIPLLFLIAPKVYPTFYYHICTNVTGFYTLPNIDTLPPHILKLSHSSGSSKENIVDDSNDTASNGTTV